MCENKVMAFWKPWGAVGGVVVPRPFLFVADFSREFWSFVTTLPETSWGRDIEKHVA